LGEDEELQWWEAMVRFATLLFGVVRGRSLVFW
jgi:hypothetical protein